ncbi:MAG: AraC family transcriptional regulator [Oscillospiraceae bacterium]|nr:AraC family transcriptional regulator [Oscillospiraceae bacterium]
MDWITGIQRAINYIEAHLTEEIDYERVARESFSSSFHFQRVFSILCGYTLGEYIRCRRLSLAGQELATGKAKVIDVALKYGYDSPDSFAKAFQRFHGIAPSQARAEGAVLRSFSRLSIKISLEGGNVMNYRIEEKPELILTGFKKRFTGAPLEMNRQDHEFAISTRMQQYLLEGLAHDCDTSYSILTNFADDGYDYYYAVKLTPAARRDMVEDLGAELASQFEHITIPAGQYLVCQTERCKYPIDKLDDLRRQAVTEWLPSMGCELAGTPEVNVIHWFWREGDEQYNSSRYCEVWLPIVKK